MLGLSLWKMVIIGGVIATLFGRGRVSELMGDLGKGIRNFKSGMADEATPENAVRVPVLAKRNRP